MPGTRDDVRLMALGQARRPKLQEMLEERETGTLNWGDQRGFSEETLGKAGSLYFDLVLRRE